jgi:hypothetical protein
MLVYIRFIQSLYHRILCSVSIGVYSFMVHLFWIHLDESSSIQEHAWDLVSINYGSGICKIHILSDVRVYTSQVASIDSNWSSVLVFSY